VTEGEHSRVNSTAASTRVQHPKEASGNDDRAAVGWTGVHAAGGPAVLLEGVQPSSPCPVRWRALGASTDLELEGRDDSEAPEAKDERALRPSTDANARTYPGLWAIRTDRCQRPKPAGVTALAVPTGRPRLEPGPARERGSRYVTAYMYRQQMDRFMSCVFFLLLSPLQAYDAFERFF
jgi:hypothetical protein